MEDGGSYIMKVPNDLNLIEFSKLETDDLEELKSLMHSSLRLYYLDDSQSPNTDCINEIMVLIEKKINSMNTTTLHEVLGWLDIVGATVIFTNESKVKYDGLSGDDLLTHIKNKIIPKILLSYNLTSNVLDEYKRPLYFPINTYKTDLIDGSTMVVRVDLYGKYVIDNFALRENLEDEHKLLNLRASSPQDVFEKVRNGEGHVVNKLNETTKNEKCNCEKREPISGEYPNSGC